jgi:threonine aldolase
MKERSDPGIPVDLRSDTVTRPTPEMRQAMANADVGDDVYGEDPTVNRLEERAAELFGKPAAIFVPTGTMGNQVAIKVHTQPGQEIICEERAHIFNYEMAMLSRFSGCLPRPVTTPDGLLRWPEVRRKISGKTYYLAQTGLISLENTSNMWGGIIYPQEIADEVCERAHEAGLPVHLDGARIFNAAVVLGKPVAELARKFDSVMFCLSKGLGAPAGSMLLGSSEFIVEARKVRKALGGGMRQAGILAAAGLIALEKHPSRLHEDHANAQFLAQGLAQVPGIRIDPAKAPTNILIFDISGTGMDSSEFSRKLRERQVLASGVNGETMRFVTHMDVGRAACERALRAVEAICTRNAVRAARD